MRSMKLKEATGKVAEGIKETLTYCDFPSEHWARIRTNNVIDRINQEIRRRPQAVDSFPDGNSALVPVCTRLHHVSGTQWGNNSMTSLTLKIRAESTLAARFFCQQAGVLHKSVCRPWRE